MVRTADMVIIGTGIQGCSATLHYRQRGLSVVVVVVVVVVEKDHAGRHTSDVNAGGTCRQNRHPAEIENALVEHPAVAEAAVVGLPDEQWGEIISCFIRTEGNRESDPQELHRHCRGHLSPQKTPAVWCRVDAFPLTGSGKIQKFALREKYLAGDYDGGKHDR
jgi:acyl-CoA synthetase (AMP-forming)/AMP-acid ligase II